MEPPFDDSLFNPNIISHHQNQPPPPSNEQKSSQGTITNDLIDMAESPISSASNNQQKDKTSLSFADTIAADYDLTKSMQSLYPDQTYQSFGNPVNASQTQAKPSKQKESAYSYGSTAGLFGDSPVKETLTGIHGFFNSKELPPTPKQISLSDIPPGLEGIPFIFQNKLHYHGIDLFDQYMKFASTSEEKTYYKILKIMCLIKLSMWDNVMSEFSGIGNLEKMISETTDGVYLPYHLRLLYALTPFLSASQQKAASTSHNKGVDDKTLDRLFSLYYFCERKVGEFVPKDTDLYHDENIDMFTICDADISPGQWVARLFRTTLIILEILIFKMSTRTANELIKNALQRFPRNDVLMAYLIRLKQLQGDFAEAKFFLDKMFQKLPKDEYLEFFSFNTFLQLSCEMKFPEAKSLIDELAHKYPQYSTLAYNNLAYIYFAEGQIEKAISILEEIIRTEPWNINEVIVLNLIHLYDFYYADNKNRKKILEEIVDRYAMNFNKAAILNEIRS